MQVKFAGKIRLPGPDLIFRVPGFIFALMKKYIIVLIIVFCTGSVTGLENISVYGRLIDYAWSHSEDELAILMVDPNESNVIFVIDADSAEVQEKYFLPETVDFNCFDWNAEDNGFLLAGPKLGEFPESSFFSFNQGDHSFAEVYKDLKRGRVYIDNIAVEYGSDRWAAAYSGEGHPDIYIYNKKELIVLTDVYPGIITLVDWKDSFVYCMSDVRLDTGLSRKKREESYRRSGEENEGISFYDSSFYVDERLRLYKIDPAEAAAEESEKYYKDLIDTSPSGTYTVDFSQITLPESGLTQVTVSFF